MKRIFIILVFIPVLNWNCTPANKNNTDSEKFQIVENIRIVFRNNKFMYVRPHPAPDHPKSKIDCDSI